MKKLLKKSVILMLGAGLILGAVPAAAVSSEATAQVMAAETARPALKDEFSNVFKMGVAAPAYALDDAKKNKIITTNFNSMTMENEMKPDSILDTWANKSNPSAHKDEAALNFSNCDKGLKYAKSHGIKVRGHVLVWHSQTPNWFFYENYDESGTLCSKEQMLRRMENYIKDVIEHTEKEYPGVIYAWDVANECVADWPPIDGAMPMRDYQEGRENGNSMWYRVIGEDFVQKAFEYARKYTKMYAKDHEIKLFYNDYNEYNQAKQNGIIKLLNPIVKAGNIDGIGMQSHFDMGLPLYDNSQGYMTALRKYSKTFPSLEIQVTELDISLRENSSDTEETQGTYFYDYMKALLEEKLAGANVTSVTVWGITDDMSWKGENAKCLLFRKDGSAKPAYDGFIKAYEKVMAKVSAAKKAVTDIGEVAYTKDCEAKLLNAEKLYNELSDKEKPYVDNAAELTAARESFDRLKTADEAKKKEEEKKKQEAAAKANEEKKKQEAAAKANAAKVGDSFTAGGLCYQITALGASENTVEVTSPASKNKKSISIPATVTYKGRTCSVTAIKKAAFKGMKKLTSAVIGKNIKTIGNNAFKGCTKLKKVTIKSQKLQKVGKSAFAKTSGKLSFKLPKSKKKKYKKLLKKARK